jgi:peptidoglycan/LPS O-acetylase OafA/YrhL
MIFASNLALLLFPHVVGAAQTWSVSVEEQFYAIWPLLLRIAKKRPWLMLIGVIVGKLALQRLVAAIDARRPEIWLTVLSRFLDGLKFELMAIGGLGAWMMMTWPNAFKRVFSSRSLLLIAIVALGIQLWVFSQPLLIGCTCAVVLLAVVQQRLSFKPLAWVGSISYGVYMYHPIAMLLGFGLLHYAGVQSGVWGALLEYALILGITFAVSVLSFRYIERPFLRRKQKYSAILSG